MWREIRGDFREEKETKFIYIKINRSKKRVESKMTPRL